jgi:hypothetical protein
VDRDQSGSSCGEHVVVDTIPDVRDLTRPAAGELDDPLEEDGIRLPDPRLSDDAITSA